MTKQALRQLYKQKRLELDEHTMLKWNDLLLIQFQQLAIPPISTLLSYWPMVHQKEPQVDLMTRYLDFLIPELITCYPSILPGSYEMEAFQVDEDTDFITNQWGIAEPINAPKVAPSQIEIVFVPLLAFDEQGYRVGYGKGYYDRFLAKCSPNLLKIGFSHFEPVAQISDTDQFDVPLNYCITPQHIYEF